MTFNIYAIYNKKAKMTYLIDCAGNPKEEKEKFHKTLENLEAKGLQLLKIGEFNNEECKITKTTKRIIAEINEEEEKDEILHENEQTSNG